jgi:hypothetical protein
MPPLRSSGVELKDLLAPLLNVILVLSAPFFRARPWPMLEDRLANLDNGVFERLGRYESALTSSCEKSFLRKSARMSRKLPVSSGAKGLYDGSPQNRWSPRSR